MVSSDLADPATLMLTGSVMFSVHLVFRFIAWIAPEADGVVRRRLDEAFDTLDKCSPLELARRLLERVRCRVQLLAAHPLRTYVLVVAVSLFLNVIVAAGTFAVVVSSHFSSSLRTMD